MRKEKSTVLLALLIVFGMTAVVFIVPSAASVSAELPDLEPVDVGPKLRDADYGIDAVPESGRYKAASAAAVGDTKLWLSLDDYEGYYFFTYYELRAVGVHTEVWVQTELSYPEGDPREYPVVTDEQIAQLLGEFESNIYPTDTGYFGATDYHDGTYSLLEAWGYVEPGYYSDDTGKDVILVSNIRDDAYYDSTYPYYIAGFYSSSFEAYFDRNIISIDSHDWANRVGPDGARPYLYEAIIAHEEQHLIHDDYQPDDASYLNEGCSMYAELLCGYGIPWGDINSYLATPDNSLTDWGDQGGINILADYGAAAMWAIYLNDQFGDTFWSQYMANGVPDTLGLEALFGGLTFDEVFHNWKVANLVDSDFGGFYPEYAYTTLDLDSPDAEPIRVYQINEVPIPWTAGSSFGTTTTILGYDTGISLLGPYGSDYISIRKFPKPWSRKLFFDGNDYASVQTWSLADGVWYSGAVDLMNTLIAGEAYVDPANPELVLTTYWDIEDYWDFGFVQVSTDGGATWTSLANEYTTTDHDSQAHPDIIANLPGLTSWSGFLDEDGWITMSFDLTAYAGQDVLIGFRYMTDWGTLYPGWYIEDSVTVSDASVEFSVADVIPEADFQVTLVYFVKMNGEVYPVWVDDLNLDPMTEEGSMWLPITKPFFVVMIVSTTHDSGFADYSFKVGNLHKHGFPIWGM